MAERARGLATHGPGQAGGFSGLHDLARDSPHNRRTHMSRQRQAAELAALLDELLKAVDLFQAVMFLDGEWACEGLQFLDPSADVAAIVARAVVLAGRLSLPVPDSLLKYQYSGHSLTEAVKPRDAGLFRTGDGWRNWEAMRFIDWKFEWDKPVIVLRNAARQIAAENHTGGNGGSSVRGWKPS